MATLVNRAKVSTATTGTGTITLGTAEGGYLSFADAGVSDGDTVRYVIEEGNNFEIGTGTYTASGTTLTRTPSESSKADNTAITLAGEAVVYIAATKDDFVNAVEGGTFTGNVDFSGGIDVTGNITVTGTVDGRDIATDGSKLDGIESGATGDQTAAEIRSLVESATDSNVFTDADHTKLNGIATNANNYSLPLSSSSTRGGVKIGYTENGKNYPVELSNEQMYVNVPWTDNNTTYSAGSGLSLSGTTFSHSDTSSQGSVNNSGRTYIQDITLDTYGHITGITSATETVVNTDTTYSAGSGLSLSGTTFSHSDTSSQSSVNNSGNTFIQDITVDTYGHITALTSGTATASANDDIFWENGTNVTSNYTITNGKNAMSAGPITVNSGVTVTVGSGETWTVV